jgi:hypothetical protein
VTEAEWLACEDPQQMLLAVSAGAGERRLRLFACGFCRALKKDYPWFLGKARAVEVAEQHADGLASDHELRAAAAAAEMDVHDPMRDQPWVWITALEYMYIYVADPSARQAAQLLCQAAPQQFEDRKRACSLLRDIFGNPFCPVSFSAEWLTDTTLALARQMYESRDFSAMPILADALQDAGCDNEDLLNHCRQPGKHVRGCWALDLILGKE